MLKYSLYIQPVLLETDIYTRPRIAKNIGFDAISIWDPLDFDCTRLSTEAAKAGIHIHSTLFNDRYNNLLDIPRDNFAKMLNESIQYAKILGSSMFVALAGDRRTRTDYQLLQMEDNLKLAADIVIKNNMHISVEALNTFVNHKGNFLDSSYLAYELVRKINCPNIKTVFDCYHMQIMEGNLIANFTENIEYINQFHAAGVPGRHALYDGELNYNGIARAIERTGFDGHLAFELGPATEEELADMLTYIKKIY